MSRKSFTRSKANSVQEPIVFDIEGEEFSVPLPIPGISLLEMASIDESDSTGAIKALLQFLEDSMGVTEYKRFRSVLASKRVDIEVVNDIVPYIVEEATGNPTQPLSPSPVTP